MEKKSNKTKKVLEKKGHTKAKEPEKLKKSSKPSFYVDLVLGEKEYALGFSLKNSDGSVRNIDLGKIFKRIISFSTKIVLMTVFLSFIVSALGWSGYIWNQSVNNKYRPIQLLRSSLLSFTQPTFDSSNPDGSATSTPAEPPSIASIVSFGLKQSLSGLVAGTKKMVTNEKPTETVAQPAPVAVVPALQPAVLPIVVPTTTEIKKVVPTTTEIKKVVATTTEVKKVVPTTTPVVATTTPAPVVATPAETQPSVVQYIITNTQNTILPDTTVTSSPPLISTSTTAVFAFVANKTGVSFEYSLDNAGWISTGASLTLNNLSDMSHTLRVRGLDTSGNVELVPAQYTWLVDANPPTVTIDSGPNEVSNSNSAIFSLSANESNVVFYKLLDSGSWLSNGTTSTFNSLSEGNHVFTAYGVDNVGHIGDEINFNWLVDLSAPTASLDDLPVVYDLVDYQQSGLNVTFSGNDPSNPVASGVESFDVEYNIDGGAWQAWNSNLEQTNAVFGQTVTSGQIAGFRVRARDAAGNTGSWSATKQTTIMTTKASYVVISEIKISGDTETDEFVELYNPTSEAITLSNYVLSTVDPQGTERTLISDFQNIQLDSYKYLLFGHSDYGNAVARDMTYSTANSIVPNSSVVLYSGSDIVDKVGFGSSSDFEGAPVSTNPSSGQSLERKAAGDSTAGAMVTGAVHNLLGNSYDSNNNSNDFVTRLEPDPQNQDSDPELALFNSINNIKFAVEKTLNKFYFSLIKNWLNPARLIFVGDLIDSAFGGLKFEIQKAGQLLASTGDEIKIALNI